MKNKRSAKKRRDSESNELVSQRQESSIRLNRNNIFSKYYCENRITKENHKYDTTVQDISGFRAKHSSVCVKFLVNHLMKNNTLPRD